MSTLDRYVNHLVCQCSEESFGQMAVDWFITSGQIDLTYIMQDDLLKIMGQPGKPETGLYDTIIDAYQVFRQGIAVHGNTVDGIEQPAESTWVWQKTNEQQKHYEHQD
jgi:hypothetical protein